MQKLKKDSVMNVLILHKLYNESILLQGSFTDPIKLADLIP